MRWLLVLFCLSFTAVSQASAVGTYNGKVIEKVLVLKSAHQLQLVNDGKPLKTYRISLGRGARKGPKLIEGDKRTPKVSTGSTGARPATGSTCRCTFPTPTSAMPPAPAAKALSRGHDHDPRHAGLAGEP